MTSKSDGAGSQQTGSPTSNIAISPPSSKSTATERPRSSEIGRPAAAKPNSIGTRHSETGSVAKASAVVAQAVTGADPSSTDKALVAALPQPVALRLVSKTNSEFDLVGYNLRPGAMPADLGAALALVEDACPTSSGKMIVQELAKVMAVTISRTRDDLDEEVAYVTMASMLTEFPPDVIKGACAAWMKCEKFRPSLAELREYCWVRFRARDSLRSALRRAVC